MSHIVKTCRTVDDVEPHTLPSIPRGTYGIDHDCGDDDYRPIDFGPPWGVQRVGNHDLLDAAAVLGNAKRAIEHLKRPWRGVIRRTLKSFAGPYLTIAAGPWAEEFTVEAHLCGKSKSDAIKLLDEAIALTEKTPDPAVKLCIKCRAALEDPRLEGDERCRLCGDP